MKIILFIGIGIFLAFILLVDICACWLSSRYSEDEDVIDTEKFLKDIIEQKQEEIKELKNEINDLEGK